MEMWIAGSVLALKTKIFQLEINECYELAADRTHTHNSNWQQPYIISILKYPVESIREDVESIE